MEQRPAKAQGHREAARGSGKRLAAAKAWAESLSEIEIAKEMEGAHAQGGKGYEAARKGAA